VSRENGDELWAQRGFGEHGTLIAAAGCLLVQTGHTGELIVVRATPEQYLEARRIRTWRCERCCCAIVPAAERIGAS
jgi:hypothetical protein